MLLTSRDLAQRAKYESAQAKQFGNLHERMKLAIVLCRERELWKDNNLWQAIHDLETEVSFHVPADPPFADRVVPLVFELGRRHCAYGVRSGHYQVFGDALLGALQDELGAKFGAEEQAAWLAAYGFMAEIMREATLD